MVGRDGAKGTKSSGNSKVRRRLVLGTGGAVGAFLAAAAMATGSAAPAKADFDELLDPIIQPLLTSLTDSLAGFDPTLATDVTSWTDSLLAGLNSIDLTLPSTAEPAAAAAAAASPITGTYTLPLTLLEGTEPSVQASIAGGPDVPLLVDTGSSGLVIPYTDLGSNDFQSFLDLLQLGFPTGISESGYSGGIDYLYLTYDNVTTDYVGIPDNLSTTGPVDVEILSWPTSLSTPTEFEELFTNTAFQDFLSNNQVDGILGIGENTAGPGTSPFEAYGGVLVDIPDNQLVVEPTAPLGGDLVSGNPISNLYETVTTGGSTVGSAVSDDVDSGGVYGTIPSSLASDVAPGSTITVYTSQGGTELYSYTVGSAAEEPTSVSGTSIDSGVEPFLKEQIYFDYSNDTMTFYPQP